MALTLATFNVKDLFDVPSGDAAGRAHLDAKLDNLARIVARADADLLALQEVGSAAVVRALATRLEGGGGYGEPVVGTADARGIRCAVLSRLPLVASKVHTADHLEFPRFVSSDPSPFRSRIPLRRGVVHVTVDAPSFGTLDLLVAHFEVEPRRPVQGRGARRWRR